MNFRRIHGIHMLVITEKLKNICKIRFVILMDNYIPKNLPFDEIDVYEYISSFFEMKTPIGKLYDVMI